MSNIILTRKTNINDGFGAQYQRILGTYCICKEYGFKYLHTPFSDIEYQGLSSLEQNKNEKTYVEKCNDRIQIKSDINIDEIKNYNIIEKDLSLEELKKQKNCIIKYDFPYIISDKYPEIYKHSKGLYKPGLKKNNIFTIGIHVRRGELHVVDSDRILPNNYYINIALKLINLCNQLNLKYIIELYTEIPTKDLVITGNHVGIKNRINTNINIAQNQDNISEFDVIPNLVKYINEDTLDTFDRMINCDVLLTSRSSFSACASYLKNGISIYHPFWHNMMNRDIPYNDLNFNNKINSFLETFVNKIPNIIHQVWLGSKQIPSYVETNLKILNPEYKYIFYKDDECINFIKTYFNHVLETFNNIKLPQHKCDLFRYCLLYKYGGVYLDIDLEMKQSFNTIITNNNCADLIAAIGAHTSNTNNVYEVCNGYIITIPNNPIFLELIDLIIKNPNPTDYGLNVKNFYSSLKSNTLLKPYQYFEKNNTLVMLQQEVNINNKYYVLDDKKDVIFNSNGHLYI